MNWTDEVLDVSVPVYALLVASLAASLVYGLVVWYGFRHERRRHRERRSHGVLLGRSAGPGTLAWGGVVQRRHPMECSDCGDDRRREDGLCWSCGGGRRQPKGVHRESAA